MVDDTIGREAELKRLAAFFDARGLEWPRALVLLGEAGIGKSTLWLRGLELARERGMRVLSSRPAEAERNYALAGLGDLFEGVLDEVLPALAQPRQRALRVALLLEETQDTLTPRAVAVAVRSALELLAEAQPLLVAVDDVQWLDPSSTAALAFALRRADAPMHLLIARRSGPTDHASLESALPAPSVEGLHVGPLTLGALQAILRERVDRVFPRPTLLRIHETSGGNPFYALELARALPHELDPSGPLPVPETLEELLRARIDALPGSARQALVLLSALGEAETETLRRAGAEDSLETAVSHGIVVRASDRLRFTHPLLAASVYQHADEATRRSAHAALAGVLRDPLERARHLALAAEGADAETAASLDQAAIVAGGRGVPTVVAELSELARRLTPEDDRDGRHRRAIVAGLAHLRAGDVGRARSLADETDAEAEDDRARAEALVLMSAVERAAGKGDRAVALRREALAFAAGDPALAAAVHQWLAVWSGDERAKEDHASASLDLAERLDDDLLRAGALAVLARLRFARGEPDAVALAEQAHELGSRARLADRVQPSAGLAHLLAWGRDRNLVASFVLVPILVLIGRFETARALLDDLEREVTGRNEQTLAPVLGLRSMLELRAGRWLLADELGRRQRELATEYQSPDWAGPYVVFAEVALHRGELEQARGLAARGRELAVADPGWLLHDLEALFGLADRADGAPAAAVPAFTAAEAAAEARGLREPALFRWRADFAETLLELGRVDDAVELLDAWEPDARRLGRDLILAHITRCRGLVAAARGDVGVALTTLERAVDEADAERDPFGHARALLALGVTRRRARQKRRAREAIAAALEGFEALGEVIWTKRARAELGRIGGRRREEGLTAAERRVAALVADGRTNREVATALSLGERTVETHLTHIYAKLGIRTRTELARVYEPAS